MCGIVGISGPYRDGDEDLVRGLLTKISYRGPDDLQVVHIPGLKKKSRTGATIGAVRLAITDPERGRQPVLNQRGTTGVVLNGEVYNYRELNGRLAQLGYPATTECDTETFLHMFEEYGVNAQNRVRGMFAFLGYDAEKDLFMAARDPFGIKPVYHVRDKFGRTIFCSEMGPLQDLALQPGEVHVLEPGAKWVNGKISQYYKPKIKSPPTSEKLRAAVIDAVESHLPENLDEPVGIFLSGGLDSGLIAAIAAQKHRNLTAFIATTDQGGSDAQPAVQLAKKLGIPYELVVIDPKEVRESVPDVIKHLETYNYDQVLCALPYWFISKAAKQHGLKVVLGGEGSDEIFGGYRYPLDWWEHRSPYQNDRRGTKEQVDHDVIEMAMRTSLSQFLGSSELQRGDRMTAAFGLELRVPFLDRKLVDLAMSIPIDEKVPTDGPHAGKVKVCLREAFREVSYVPTQVIDSPKIPVFAGSGVEHYATQPAFIAHVQACAAESIQHQPRTDQPPAMMETPRRNPQERLVEEAFYHIWRGQFPAIATHFDHLADQGKRPHPARHYPRFYTETRTADNFGKVAGSDGPVKPSFRKRYQSKDKKGSRHTQDHFAPP